MQLLLLTKLTALKWRIVAFGSTIQKPSVLTRRRQVSIEANEDNEIDHMNASECRVTIASMIDLVERNCPDAGKRWCVIDLAKDSPPVISTETEKCDTDLMSDAVHRHVEPQFVARPDVNRSEDVVIEVKSITCSLFSLNNYNYCWILIWHESNAENDQSNLTQGNICHRYFLNRTGKREIRKYIKKEEGTRKNSENNFFRTSVLLWIISHVLLRGQNHKLTWNKWK